VKKKTNCGLKKYWLCFYISKNIVLTCFRCKNCINTNWREFWKINWSLSKKNQDLDYVLQHMYSRKLQKYYLNWSTNLRKGCVRQIKLSVFERFFYAHYKSEWPQISAIMSHFSDIINWRCANHDKCTFLNPEVSVTRPFKITSDIVSFY
jgi:hypothetical protein